MISKNFYFFELMVNLMYLKRGINHSALKTLSVKQKIELCHEIRGFLVKSVKNTGGHLSPNLGVVEMTVALHSVFESPKDKFVFDVGHQAYVHKMLTGRLDRFHTLRQKGGISGFPRPDESEHDAFIAGHSSISISAAVGIAQAMALQGNPHHTVAVIGDGAFTGGIAYEGLNNAGKTKANLIIILNDNGMSISKNKSAIAMYLSHIRSSGKYLKTKKSVKYLFDKTPIVGKNLDRYVGRIKHIFKDIIYRSNLFENFGINYIGPVDGHNLYELIRAFEAAKMSRKPSIVHVYTKKGKGYLPAEENPAEYHGISSIKVESKSSDTFSDIMGKTISEFADKDDKICAITAAMKYGTGLQHFCSNHRSRFFDAGIAEQHCVTFAGGLAKQGMKPVFAVYSSFLQRGLDQIIHDISICPLHVVFAIDRAGFVGEDGATHQGIFDVSMLMTVPNMVVYSPSNYTELRNTLKKALYEENCPVAVRYPKGREAFEISEQDTPDFRFSSGTSDLVITYGRLSADLPEIHRLGASTLQLIKIHPLPREIVDICSNYERIFIFEESMENGGVAAKIAVELSKIGYKGSMDITAIRNHVLTGTIDEQLDQNGLSKAKILAKIYGESIGEKAVNE